LKNLSVLLIILFFLLICSTKAQNLSDSLQIIPKTFSTDQIYSNFNKQLNTYRLRAGLDLDKNIGKLNLYIKELFNSTLIRANENNIRSEHSLFINSTYRFKKKIDLGLLIRDI